MTLSRKPWHIIIISYICVCVYIMRKTPPAQDLQGAMCAAGYLVKNALIVVGISIANRYTIHSIIRDV